MKPLAGLRVLDLTQRLPGPLAGHLLSLLGADVTKLEDERYQDAFIAEGARPGLENFRSWYDELNRHKTLVRLDFSAPSAAADVRDMAVAHDIILSGLPEKISERLGLSVLDAPKVLLKVGASKHHEAAMHDLNALAFSGFLALHVEGQTQSPMAPPFMPVAGISFGQQIALTALALHCQAQREQKPIISEVFLYDELLKVMGPLWAESLRQQKQTKFLHNGAFPCYCLYRNKDGDWLAVAAVEEKFWNEFVRLFNLPLSADDRFSTDPQVFQHVVQAIEVRSTVDLQSLLANKQLCVSILGK